MKITKEQDNINIIEPGAHLCSIFENDEELKTLLSTFLVQGLKRREKVMYIMDTKTPNSILDNLQNNGLDLKPYLDIGQLKVLYAAEVYMQKGIFNPDVMITFLRNETERALVEGYTALRVMSEMSWAIRKLPSVERLIEYDAKLNEFFPNSKCLAICLYDGRRFDSEILLDVFAIHPKVVIDTVVYENYYYLAPTDFLGENRPATTLQNWLENLAARKKAEENLIHISNAIKISLDSIIISSLEGKILDVNDATLKMYEIEEKNDLIGENFFNFIAPEQQEKALQDIDKVLKNGCQGSHEYNVITHNGSKIPVVTNLDLMKNKEGEPIGFIGIMRDITDRKQTEEKLRESEEKYRTLFNSTPEAIALIGLDGTILDCNNVIEKITGLRKRELIGKSFTELNMFIDEDISKLIELFPKAISGESIGPIDMAIQLGKEKGWMEVFPALLKNGSKGHALQLIVRDITDRKRAEEDMKRRLMKFKLEDGKVYLVQESNNSLSMIAFKDLIKVGYGGLVISRTPEKYFKKSVLSNVFEFLWLAEKGDENTIPPKLNEIELRLANLPRKSAIFIDRVDYIIFKNGFKKTLSFVQHLREFAYLAGHIVVISIDPSTLSKQELRLLEKESAELEPRPEKKNLPDEQLKILRHIYEDNIIGVKPTFTKIGHELRISKPTVRKRIRLLTSAGYIFEIVKGRNKVVELTEMGRNLFFS